MSQRVDIGFINADSDHIMREVIPRDRLVDTSPGISGADREAHPAFVATLDDKPVWQAIWNKSFGVAQNRYQRRLAAEPA